MVSDIIKLIVEWKGRPYRKQDTDKSHSNWGPDLQRKNITVKLYQGWPLCREDRTFITKYAGSERVCQFVDLNGNPE